ncbi:hypothetical protein L345_09472, partial [Ophiophagus hannah]
MLFQKSISFSMFQFFNLVSNSVLLLTVQLLGNHAEVVGQCSLASAAFNEVLKLPHMIDYYWISLCSPPKQKILSYQGPKILVALFNQIIEEGAAPSIVVPIWKGKGDMSECLNYQLIWLLCHTMKIFEWVIDIRLHKIVSIISNQCGFVKGSRTMDAIHAAQLLLSLCPVDSTIGLTWSNVQWEHCTPFAINVGVHQGLALSPLLFVLSMALCCLTSYRPTHGHFSMPVTSSW